MTRLRGVEEVDVLPPVARLAGPLRHYAWGSHTQLAHLEGRLAPTSVPEAERWFGAHPGDPAVLDPDGLALPLDAAIASDPAAHLGGAALPDAGDGPTLPYLVKLLGVGAPLSLQLHPGTEAAAAGFAAEEAALSAGHEVVRRFTDPWPKPELLVALTPVEALCGILGPAAMAERLQWLGGPATAGLVEVVAAGPDAVRDAVAHLLGLPEGERRAALATTVEACRDVLRRTAGAVPPPVVAMARWLEQLAARWPDDPALLVALLLDHIELEPGQALDVPAGTLHAYLHGTGLEVMRASDNVLRAGFTPKLVDTAAVVDMLLPRPGEDHRLRPLDGSDRPLPVTGHAVDGPAVRELAVADPALRVVVLAPDRRHDVPTGGARVLLALGGEVTVAAGDTEVALAPAQAAYLPATTTAATVSGTGAAVVVGATDHR